MSRNARRSPRRRRRAAEPRATEAEPAPEPVEPIAAEAGAGPESQAEKEPEEPKRRGWWSRAIGGA